MDASSDHHLMLAVREGDLRHLGELFERHHRRLYGYFYRVTGQSAVSEDLVQTVFQQILKYRHTYRDDGNFVTWFYQIARNLVARHFRTAGQRLEDADEDGMEQRADEAPIPPERAVVTDDLEILQRALSSLPPGQREILTLTHLQNVAHKDIAEVLECSTTVVKVRVHRALQALRKTYFRIQEKGLVS